MTIKQIEKHGEVIKWFVDNPDKGVWTKRFNSDDDDWSLMAEPSWLTNWQYIQNDEKAELRKQVADGVILQYYDNGKWKDAIHISATFSECKLENLRVKPQFKVGDWVVEPQINNGKPFQVSEVDLIDYNNYTISGVTLWEPKEGELCIFWDADCTEYFIGKYATKALTPTFGNMPNCTDIIYTKQYWDYVAPLEFVQTLKDKQ